MPPSAKKRVPALDRPSRNLVLGMDEWMDGSYITDVNLIRRVFVESPNFGDFQSCSQMVAAVKRYGFQVQPFTLCVHLWRGKLFSFFPDLLVQDGYHMLSPVVRPLENLEVEIDGLGICSIISHESSVFYNSYQKYSEIIYYGPIGCSWQRYRKWELYGCFMCCVFLDVLWLFPANDVRMDLWLD